MSATTASSVTIDLHSHTTASDGVLSPTELVHEASRRGITVLGVADHDTIDGLEEATRAGVRHAVEIVPALELSTTSPVGEYHLLAYFVDRTDSTLVGSLHRLAQTRVTRVRTMLEKLRALGYAVDIDAVMSQADSGSIGRPHIARELMRLGVVKDVSEGFDRFLKSGRPAFVPREPFAPQEAIALTLANGAVPVLAHPFSTRDPEGAIQWLKPLGLRGIEVYYAAYSPAQRQALGDLADRHGLLKTGGSDYHGGADREGRELGTAAVPPEVLAPLRAAVGR